MKQTKKMTRAALVAALYIAVMYVTQGFAFGAYQIRIATALYALSFLAPYLAVPLAIANALSNLLGGLGMLDIIGGLAVGLVTGGAILVIRHIRLPAVFVVAPIVLGPGLIVPLWLSGLLGLPYWALVVNISIGQVTPAVIGYILIRALQNRKVDLS